MNEALNAVEWWRLLVVGFLLGMGCLAIGIWALATWAQGRPYMPGPFARPDYDVHRREAQGNPTQREGGDPSMMRDEKEEGLRRIASEASRRSPF